MEVGAVSRTGELGCACKVPIGIIATKLITRTIELVIARLRCYLFETVFMMDSVYGAK